jgi:hypothetical protein
MKPGIAPFNRTNKRTNLAHWTIPNLKTEKLQTPFVLLSESVVRPERFELPAFWFVARRSIQLSYGRTVRKKFYHVPQVAARRAGFRQW